MSWNIGANDVANAMGTSVGSGALSLKQAVILAGIFEFCGAFFMGSNVTQTIQKGIVDLDVLRAQAVQRAAVTAPGTKPADTEPAIRSAPDVGDVEDELRMKLAIGMLSALLGAAVWLNVATFFSQPVSTTHAIVGSVIGFVLILAGPGAVVWSKVGAIAASWVISPLAGALLAYLIYRLIQRFVIRSRHPVFMARRAVPLGFGSVVFILSLSILYKVMHLSPKTLWHALPVAAVMGMLAGVVARAILLRKTRHRRVRRREQHQVVERWFGRIQPITACYMAFSHGANDVANAIGPLAGVVHFATGGPIGAKTPVPAWLLALGGVGIVVGLGTYGYKVMMAIGKKITEITPTRGFAAEFGTATTVLVCSLLGMPVSTTFVLVGAVMGVGLARGFGAIDMKVVRRIFASWLITIPASAVFTAIIFYILSAMA